MIYRVLADLNYKGQLHKKGELVDMDLPINAQHKLLNADVIAQVSGPPLSIVDGWEARARRLEKLDIVSAEQFLTADVEQIARALHVRAQTVADWRAQIEQLLIP